MLNSNLFFLGPHLLCWIKPWSGTQPVKSSNLFNSNINLKMCNNWSVLEMQIIFLNVIYLFLVPLLLGLWKCNLSRFGMIVAATWVPLLADLAILKPISVPVCHITHTFLLWALSRKQVKEPVYGLPIKYGWCHLSWGSAERRGHCLLFSGS